MEWQLLFYFLLRGAREDLEEGREERVDVEVVSYSLPAEFRVTSISVAWETISIISQRM